ncbi:MAG: hypothetical protein IKX35_04240 [Bacteroidales bacterium]|nr:hypothetical protein [Bacteroidales bacterium]
MRRIAIFAMLVALFLFNACEDTVSKQFKAMEEEISSIENQINTIDDCDELQMMNIAILGLRSDMDNYRQDSEMTDTEIGQLDDMIDKLEATWNGKWASLNCEEGIANDVLDTSGEEVGDFD